jgi:hypothetical protein
LTRVPARLARWRLAIAASAAAQSPMRSIDIAYDGDLRRQGSDVRARDAAIAWDVLTDFPNMAKWYRVSWSTVVKPGDKQFTIEQRGNAKFARLSPYTSVREIVLNPRRQSWPH